MIERSIILEGNFVRLEEVKPEFFEYIIEWRNKPDNNKFLNQPFKLTAELQNKWYEEKYMHDMTQGLLVMVDKSNDVPFGTIGWTDYNKNERICIAGRSLVGNLDYRASKEQTESYILLYDYLYYTLDVNVMYIHVVDDNKRVISLNKRWGFKENLAEIRFPDELNVQGMKQTEYLRTCDEYVVFRNKFINILNLL